MKQFQQKKDKESTPITYLYGKVQHNAKHGLVNFRKTKNYLKNIHFM